MNSAMENTTTRYEELKRSENSHSPILVSSHEEMNPSKRCAMEDCSVFYEPGTWGAPDDISYLGVYDGHGGRDIVEYLEHGLSFHVAQELSCTDDASIETRLERAFLMADIHSLQLGLTHSGATVAICLVKKQPQSKQVILYTANAGDTRIVLGHEGKATRLTRDHSIDDPEECIRIKNAGGFIFKGRVCGFLAVTRSLGDHCLKNYVIATPHVSKMPLELPSSSSDNNNNNQQQQPSFLILACDGLWDVFRDQQAVDFVLQYQGDKSDISKHLVNEALRRGSTDNITVVVAWL